MNTDKIKRVGLLLLCLLPLGGCDDDAAETTVDMSYGEVASCVENYMPPLPVYVQWKGSATTMPNLRPAEKPEQAQDAPATYAVTGRKKTDSKAQMWVNLRAEQLPIFSSLESRQIAVGAKFVDADRTKIWVAVFDEVFMDSPRRNPAEQDRLLRDVLKHIEKTGGPEKVENRKLKIENRK